MPEPNIIAINVGNTRTQLGAFVDGKIVATERFANQPPTFPAAAVEWIVHQWSELASQPDSRGGIVMASVNDAVADRLASMVEDQLTVEVFRVGDDVPVPIGTELDPETITGVDRLLNAAAAFERVKQACVVIDAGTAVTVDFIDGQGTFHGGAISPGARLQLRALHQYTAALPELEFAVPNADAFGRNTAQAMLHGVYFGIRGMVRQLVERYAERYGAYPQIIATGGDADVLFKGDELVDTIVPDLTLRGIAAAAKYSLAGEEGEAASDDDQLRAE